MIAKNFLAFASLLAAVLLSGCATSRNTVIREEFRSIDRKYQTQAYAECLAEIEKTLTAPLIPLRRGQLLMAKGLCLEEQGQGALADEIYRQIVAQYPMTPLADRAQKRLEHRDGDQKEHVELSFPGEGWRRAEKEMGPTWVECRFHPANEDPSRARVGVVLFSMDRTEKVGTIQEAIARLQATGALRERTVDVQRLEQTETEAILETHVRARNGQLWSSGVTRVVLTAERFHALDYKCRGAMLSPPEKEEWIARLKKVKLVNPRQTLDLGPPVSAPTSSLPRG